MANVFPLSFPPRPNNPSPFGFGFGGTTVSSPSYHQPPVHSPSPSAFGSPLRRPPPTTPSAGGFGRPYQSPSPSPFGQFGTASGPPSLKRTRTAPSTSSAGGGGESSKRRAREDESSEEEDEEMGLTGEVGGSITRRKIAGGRGSTKKSRVDPEPDSSPHKPSATTDSNATQQDGVDVGVLLALLPQSSLLPILTSLITLHPTLKPSLLMLIPTPSLSSALDALRQADEKVRQAVPFGWSPAGGGVSEAYVLARIQAPIQELASLIQSHLPFFTAPHPLPTSPPPHPLTTFPYLQYITTTLLRLSSSLPSPLTPLELLWPRVAREWLQWTAAVSELVNKQGGMVGAGVAEGWVRELDGFAARGSGTPKGLEAKMRGEMGVVRERWVAEVGWLVNRRVGDQGPGGFGESQQDVGMGMMEEEEEL